jgi:hypothetical protein
MVLASSGRDTSWMRMAKWKVLVRWMGLTTGSSTLSLMWNNVTVWSNPKYLSHRWRGELVETFQMFRNCVMVIC